MTLFYNNYHIFCISCQILRTKNGIKACQIWAEISRGAGFFQRQNRQRQAMPLHRFFVPPPILMAGRSTVWPIANASIIIPLWRSWPAALPVLLFPVVFIAHIVAYSGFGFIHQECIWTALFSCRKQRLFIKVEKINLTMRRIKAELSACNSASIFQNAL